MKLMNEKLVQKYCRNVGKKLCCRSDTKKRLLEGLQQELAENDLGNLSYDRFLSRFGTPDEVAAQLMEAVDLEEAASQAKRRKRRLICLVAVVIVVLFLATVVYIYHLAHGAVTYIEETIETISEQHY